MTPRKVNMAMVSNTPIRLVAIDEEPPDEDVTVVEDFLPEEHTVPTPVSTAAPAPAADSVQEAAPLRSTPEHEAITRKVPGGAPVAAQVAEWPKPIRTWRKYLPFMIALVPLIALSMAWILSRSAQTPDSRTSASAPNQDQVPPTSAPVPTASPRPTLVPSPAAASLGKKAPEIIRLQITAEPVQAELGLDGNVLARHRLNLEVPKDRGIHVVSASAPGYYPFTQQVSFSDDITLHINLRRAQGPGRQNSRQRPSRAEARTQMVSKPAVSPPQVEAKPQSGGKSHPAPSAPRMEPGMDLDAPAPRRGAKSLDERNPYRP